MLLRLAPTLAIWSATEHILALIAFHFLSSSLLVFLLLLVFFSSCSWLLFLLSLVNYLVCLWLLVLFLFSVLTVLCLCHLPLSMINNNNFLTTFFCAKLYTLHGILHCMELCQLPFETDVGSCWIFLYKFSFKARSISRYFS